MKSLKKRLHAPFVVTVSALGAVACSRDAATTTAPSADARASASAEASANANVSVSPSVKPIPNSDGRARLEDYPRSRNVEDAQKRTVFRGYKGDTCHVELAWPKGMVRSPGEAPPTLDVPCPSEMKTAAWDNCRGASILSKADGSECVCFQMGNPPPVPRKIACP